MGCGGTGGRSGIEEKFTRQDRFVERLRAFSTDSGAHLTLVVHPRKVEDDHLLSIASLYGGGKISQEADNIMLVQEEIGTAVPKRYLQVGHVTYFKSVDKFYYKVLLSLALTPFPIVR